ncbi:MAG: ClpP/crotonase-like domain-containing protein [Monoraphidium minutum]|nr:MAG: ClpP/crotonase-like domain-containing protein [Monoraphidium minutum]
MLLRLLSSQYDASPQAALAALAGHRLRRSAGAAASATSAPLSTSAPPAAAAAGDAQAAPPVLVEDHGNHAVITLNRPKALNALSSEVCRALLDAARRLDAGGRLGAIVITGAGRAFAAGADIKELEGLSQEQARATRPVELLDGLSGVSTPLIAAVNGFALGGGCELAMMCDVIVASEAAVFGLPELQLGVIPAMGGTQRLPRLVGRALAMDMILTGRRLSAHEALAAGLVSRVAPDALSEAAALACRVAAAAPRGAAARAKAAVRAAEALPLAEGMDLERSLFYDCFGPDQKEGMAAFREKRPPRW